MLVLTRRVGETLIIELPDGQEIRVTVTGLNGNQVRLGTEAPLDIRVWREELASFRDSASCDRSAAQFQ